MSGQKFSLENSDWSVAELGAFFAIHRKSLTGHALRLVGDRSVAEELVQDALVKVILAAPELESETHALAYMTRTINNLSIDHFRRQGRQPRLVLLEDIQDETVLDQPKISGLDDIVSAADDAAIIRDALSLLSPSERAALVMWELEGRSTKEISRELGIKESSVRHTLYRARAVLRRVLEEVIVDESRGLTALDLLSSSYSRFSKGVKSSSKAALSLMLVVFAFLGFNSLPNDPIAPNDKSTAPINSVAAQPTDAAKDSLEVDEVQTSQRSREAGQVENRPYVSGPNLRVREPLISGLDNQGVPVGFTISDSSGGLGTLYVSERAGTSSELELVASQILKTEGQAANLLLSQKVVSDITGLSYLPTLSYSREGRWVPLLTSVSSLRTERILSGNYLVIASIEVESEVETSLIIPAQAGGRDLEFAPKQVITRLLLSAEKTRVLAQAIYVVEGGAK